MNATSKRMMMTSHPVLAAALIALLSFSAVDPVQASRCQPQVNPKAKVSALVSAQAPVTVNTHGLRLLVSPSPGTPVLLADASTVSKQSEGRGRQGRLRGFFRAMTRRPQVVDAAAAARLIKGGDSVFVPVGVPSANMVFKALSQRAKAPGSDITPEKPVSVVGLCHSVSRGAFDREGRIIHRSLFLGANARDPVASGKSSFVPAYFHRVPRMIREGQVPVDVALLQVSKPDALGFVTLGPTAGSSLAAIEKARTVIAQVNDQVPTTRGATRVHISKLDYIVKANEPLPEIPAAKISDVDRQIAQHVVGLVLDKKGTAAGGRKPGLLRRTMGAIKEKLGCGNLPTFQFGIGGIPDAVAQILAESPELGSCKIRSELIGPGTQRLVESGKVRGKVQYTFAMGDKKFMGWMHKNRKLKAQAVDVLNDPARIGRTKNMMAVNSAIAVDLNGQINAQYVKGQWYSGVGGQVDFMRGAMNSKGGKAVIALPSTAMVSDGRGGKKMISKIVPHLGEGDVVTTNMHDIQYVVTEHGVAALEGKSDVERARALINIAHPQFRSELTTALDTQLAGRRQAEQTRYDRYLAREQAAQQPAAVAAGGQ